MGIALLRIVDPKLSSKAMDDYAMAYLPIAPIEILLITFVPILFVNGLGVWLLLACLVLSLLILLLAWKMDGGLLALDTIYRVLVRRFPVLETHGQ